MRLVQRVRYLQSKKQKELQAPLGSPELLAAWDEFVQHRTRMNKKGMTPQSANAIINKINAWGEKRSIEALRHSIACGYQGVFEPKQDGPRMHQQATKADYSNPL